MRCYFLLLALGVALAAQTIPMSSSGQYKPPVDARRDPWQMPDDVIKALNLSSSETVAVIEAGYPYFAPRIAPFVKKVYAVNSDPRAFQGRGAQPPGISTISATNSSPSLSRLGVDTVIMVDLLRRIPQRMPYYQALIAGLNPGGRVVIIDRKLPATFPAAARITDVIVESELQLAGFRLMQSFTFLPYQYFLVCQL
jgi:protein-L-isoaspartate O-methyltransferase